VSAPSEKELQLENHRLHAAIRDIHAARWWCTYNSALIGLYSSVSGIGNINHPVMDTIHDYALQAANLAHGQLPK
jgi:hypothetical protein